MTKLSILHESFINSNCQDKVTLLINEADMVHILLYGQLRAAMGRQLGSRRGQLSPATCRSVAHQSNYSKYAP